MNSKMARIVRRAAESQGWDELFVKQLKRDLDNMPHSVRGAMRNLLSSPDLTAALARMRAELNNVNDDQPEVAT